MPEVEPAEHQKYWRQSEVAAHPLEPGGQMGSSAEADVAAARAAASIIGAAFRLRCRCVMVLGGVRD